MPGPGHYWIGEEERELAAHSGVKHLSSAFGINIDSTEEEISEKASRLRKTISEA
jgi:hypothetical protein